MSFGTVKGSTFWHRFDEATGKYETSRCDPGMHPVGPNWVHGQRPKTEQEKEGLSNTLKGRVMTPEWKEAMSRASRGKTKSEEHRAAMSIAQKARYARMKEDKK